MSKLCLGVDTSNYTTSLALCRDGVIVSQKRRILPVSSGECGLRQSDAVFLHTKALPQLAKELFEDAGYDKRELCAVGASFRPRDVERSYMPCFLAGVSFASAVSFSSCVPLYDFSHQCGHIRAAMYSCGKNILGDFVAFHLSGGTTEILLVDTKHGISCKVIGGTRDLNAGQVIDRVGVTMGLSFPCGKELDSLSSGSANNDFKIKTSVDGLSCSLSGLENLCKSYFCGGASREDTAKYLFTLIGRTLYRLVENTRLAYPGLPILISGGVASNSILRKTLSGFDDLYFASGELSGDNACGTALLCYDKMSDGCEK